MRKITTHLQNLNVKNINSFSDLPTSWIENVSTTQTQNFLILMKAPHFYWTQKNQSLSNIENDWLDACKYNHNRDLYLGRVCYGYRLSTSTNECITIGIV